MTLPPINRQVVVPVAPAEAFEAFTGRIGSWWPLEPLQRARRRGRGRVPGRLAGRDGSRRHEAVWGKVLDWQPPRSFRMTWHPGRDAATALDGRGELRPGGRHRDAGDRHPFGLGSLGRPHANTGTAGRPCSASLATAATPPTSASTERRNRGWCSATRPRRASGSRSSIRCSREHGRFLGRLQEQGVLVGAGPFPASGEGMTIVRVAGIRSRGGDRARPRRTRTEPSPAGFWRFGSGRGVVMLHGSSLA